MKQQPTFVIPKEGVKVRDEAGVHIPAEGCFRMLTTYDNRRISDGDLIIREGEKVLPGAPAAIEVPAENSDNKKGKNK